MVSLQLPLHKSFICGLPSTIKYNRKPLESTFLIERKHYFSPGKSKKGGLQRSQFD